MQTNPKKTGMLLRLPENTIDKRAKIYWTVQIAITTTVLLVPIPILMWLLPSWRSFLVALLFFGLIGGILCLIFVPRHLFRFHRWEVTDEAVYATSGWLWREWRLAPLSRIQTVDTQHGPLEQVFGLATVIVTTASAAGPIKIVGLDKLVAAKLAERLTVLTQATHEDAT